MERNQNRTNADSSNDRATIIAKVAFFAVQKLMAEEKKFSIEEISAIIQSHPEMLEILTPRSEWKKFQQDQILRQKKEIETLKDQMQKSMTKRRTMVMQLEAAERQVSKIKDFMHRAFIALIQHVNTDKNGQLESTLSLIRELLKKRASVRELDAAFLQLKEIAFKSEVDTLAQEETVSAENPPGVAFIKRPQRESNPPINRFRKKYLKIIDELKLFLDKTALKDINKIEKRLHNTLEAYDLLEIQKELRMLLKAFVHRVGLERDQVTGFILEIKQRLLELERQILFCTAFLRETGDTSVRFTDAIEQGMTEMQGTVNITKNLEELKSRVIDSIGTIKSAIEKKRKDEWEQAQKTDEIISSFNESIKLMKLEIASSKKRTERLETEILVDPLTNIHSRRAYELCLEEELKLCQKERYVFSILFLGVDGFKQINARYGHPVGDICLKGLAGRVQPLLREKDFLSRFEGDKFMIILPDTTAQDAGKIAGKIREHIEKTNFLHKKEKVMITISIGVAEVDPDTPSAEDLFGRAEKALYQAKEEGRNRVSQA